MKIWLAGILSLCFFQLAFAFTEVKIIRLDHLAIDYTWNGSGSNSWSASTNWTPIGVPGATDNVLINLSNNAPVISSNTSINNLTINGTGILSVNAATTLTIYGDLSYDNSNGAAITLNSSSTVTFANTSSVTIPALNYGNLTRTGNGMTSLSISGIIKIRGNFTPGNGTYSTTGSTIELAPESPLTLSSFPFNNLIFSGTSTIQQGQGVNLNVAGNFRIIGNGVFVIGNVDCNNTLTVHGDFDVENTCTSCKIYLMNVSSALGATLNVNGNMNLNGGNLAELNLEKKPCLDGTGIVNIYGDLNATGINTTSGIINFGEGSNITGNKVVLNGNLTKSGSGQFITGGTGTPDGFIFNKAGVQNFNHTGAIPAHVKWQIASGSTLKLNSNFQLETSSFLPASSINVLNGGTLDMGTYNITGGSTIASVNINSGGILKTANDAGINSSGATGAIQNSGARNFDNGATYEFQGSNTGIFTTKPTANTIKNVVINNLNGAVNLGMNLTITGTLVFNTGSFKLSNSNLIVSAGNISGFNSTRYIVTNGTGNFRINNINSTTQVFPIGPNESFYNPFSFSNATGNVNVTASVYETITAANNIDPAKIVNVEWNITPSAASNATLGFNWNASQQGNKFSASIGRVYHYNPPWAILANSNVTGTSATVSGVTSFSPFIVGNEEFNLPIELSEFYGEVEDQGNVLHWVTASEMDADRIIIERTDAQTGSFEEIGYLKASGNPDKEAFYEFKDPNPFPISYYRLKLTDIDKSFVYSKVIVLINRAIEGTTRLFPNPADEILNVEFQSTSENVYEINLADMSGKQLMTTKYDAVKGKNLAALKLERLSKGLYCLILKRQSKIDSLIFIKK